MKTHLWDKSKNWTFETTLSHIVFYYSICGRNVGSNKDDYLKYTLDPDEVTCDNCKSTHIFKNYDSKSMNTEAIEEMASNLRLIRAEEECLI